MNELILTNAKGQSVTTSQIVADIFGKEHKHILRDIQELSCSDDFRKTNFGPSYYVSAQNKELPMFEMTKDGFSFLVMGYTGAKAAEFKENFINEFNKREALLKDDDYIIAKSQEILGRRVKVLEQQVTQKEEQLKIQETIIKEAAPKVEYFNEVLQAINLIPTTVIAKDLGMSAEALNEKLKKLGIQYRMGKQWVLYSHYQDKGFTGTKTTVFKDSLGNERTSIHTYWTEKGREFILKALRGNKKIA
jgi:Rha family phage regulatory protein